MRSAWLSVLCLVCLLGPDKVAAGSFELDRDGFLVTQGRRIFPNGIYSVPPQHMNEVAATGANTAANPFWARGSESSAGFLRDASSAGLFGIVGFDDDQVLNSSRSAMQKYVGDYLRALKPYSNNAGCFLPDEPISRNISRARLREIYAAVEESGNACLVILEDFDRNAPALGAGAYDVFVLDFYPIGNSSINIYRTRLRDIIGAARPAPVWVATQTYVQPPNWTEPTEEDLRTIAYLAIANGAKGILAFMHCDTSCDSYIRNHPQLWESWQRLTSEIARHSYILTLPDSKIAVARGSPDDDVDVLVKEDDERQYVIAVNWAEPGHGMLPVRVELQGRRLTAARAIVGTATEPRLEGDTFSDLIPPRSSRIYEVATQP